ncbi:MlaC/ttg2D family ABC transporter substrate-binding protein [Sedimenticola selenatireducens]|uniref:ABC transporter substrate-binding protein n=1 Tax=Sedimenticola selenatireducens TaxID=191960 RepID=A0A557SHQ5_9GAMM|nr:ABC transporter substrate-binding protein [Sedimenticola selenatireducens]TVO76921.1 ABC transporter substrate-binding protein [Sedimenticola selenatireducens]TVT64364.1 MAG: ABC transporter substrate-binding protein [Sedimenticola selenatireducens]
MGQSGLLSIKRDQILIVILLMISSFSVMAEQLAGPQQVIQRISDELQTVLMQNQEQMKSDPSFVYQLANDVLIPHVDFGHVSSLVLGKYWRRATDEQKQEFSHQFQRLLVRTYSTAFKEFQGWEISYTPLRMNEGDQDVAVHTKVNRDGAPPVDVVYQMHIKDGGWKAYDVKIEGISLVTNYRSSFAKEVRRSGMRGLIERITELNDRRGRQVTSSSQT